MTDINVYVSEMYRGKKIGSMLLQQLIESSEKEGHWTLQAGIFPENKVSVALHERNGFQLIGARQKIRKMDNVWRDTLYWKEEIKL